MSCHGGARHPEPATSGASDGAVNPRVVRSAAVPAQPIVDTSPSHTGAGFFVIDALGWLAGANARNIWQDFGGDRNGTESPWDTAAREMQEETGLLSTMLETLAPPFWVRKDHHVYVLHLARIRPSTAAAPVISAELTRFKHFTSFGDKFASELEPGEMIHRRDLEPEFLVIAAEAFRALAMRASGESQPSPPTQPPSSANPATSATLQSTDSSSLTSTSNRNVVPNSPSSGTSSLPSGCQCPRLVRSLLPETHPRSPSSSHAVTAGTLQSTDSFSPAPTLSREQVFNSPPSGTSSGC